MGQYKKLLWLWILITSTLIPVSAQDILQAVSIWDVATGDELRIETEREVHHAGWSSSGEFVAALARNAITIYSATTGESRIHIELTGHPC